MRPPSSPDGNEEEPSTEVHLPRAPRDPSYPDRAQIDSDVREYLRKPSSPWIVFNRDEGGRPEPPPPMFPRSTISGMPPAPLPLAPMPVAPPEEAAPAPGPALAPAPSVPDEDSPAEPRRRAAAIVGCVAGAVVLTVALVVVFLGRARGPDTQAIKAAASTAALPSASSPSVAASSQGTEAPRAVANPVLPPTEPAPPPAKRFGKLTIRGDARNRSVYLDGKRLVGVGQRTFTVYCGEHSIAIGEKAAAHKIDVPCGGEHFVPR